MTARPPRSLQWRLVLAFVLFAMASSAVFLYGMRAVVHAGWGGYGRPLVAGTVDLMAREIGMPPDIGRAEALARRMPIVIRIDGPRVNWSSPRPAAHLLHFGPRGRHAGDAASAGEADDDDVAYLVERRLPDGHRLRFGLAAEPPTGLHQRLAGLTLALLLGLTVAAFAYVRWLFQPLDLIRAGALRYAQGDFGHRIRLRGRRTDELGDLARRIDAMGADIGRMLDAKRALLIALSHELRSPLTRARVNAELVEEGAPRAALLRDLGQMRDLIEDLLESERLAAGHAALVREPTDLGALLAETLARHFPGVDVQVHVDPALGPVAVDPMRVRLLLRNLVDNALRHGDPGHPPEVSLAPDTSPAGVHLTVRDHGPGVPADELPRLSEAFHRPDPARGRETGGVGLGLALCRLIVQAHGGRWTLANAQPGLRVDVHLPSL